MAPQLRGLLFNWTKKYSVIGIAVTAGSVAAWNWGVRLPRIKAIDEWQKNLKLEEDYIFKRDQGSFKSAAPYGWAWKDYEWPCMPEDDDEAAIPAAKFQEFVKDRHQNNYTDQEIEAMKAQFNAMSPEEKKKFEASPEYIETKKNLENTIGCEISASETVVLAILQKILLISPGKFQQIVNAQTIDEASKAKANTLYAQVHDVVKACSSLKEVEEKAGEQMKEIVDLCKGQVA